VWGSHFLCTSASSYFLGTCENIRFSMGHGSEIENGRIRLVEIWMTSGWDTSHHCRSFNQEAVHLCLFIVKLCTDIIFSSSFFFFFHIFRKITWGVCRTVSDFLILNVSSGLIHLSLSSPATWRGPPTSLLLSTTTGGKCTYCGSGVEKVASNQLTEKLNSQRGTKTHSFRWLAISP